MKHLDTLSVSVRRQRLAWTCAVVIGLVLVYRGAPLFPVLLGCVLALLVTGLKSWPFRPGAASRRAR